MRSSLKNKFRRNRSDTSDIIHETEATTTTTPALTSTGASIRGSHVEEESQRRASEPAIHKTTSAYSNEYNGIFQAPRHQSTSGPFFGVGRSNKSKGAAEDDPLGLTLIQDADAPIVDLIFVHGLGGSSKKTWSYNRDITNFWPPWLGYEIGFKDTRIFTFGYNSKFAGASTALNILDFAKDLLFQTKNYQHPFKEDCVVIGNQPMIFIVHSMGGLVVKKAFIIGRTDDHYKDMISQTYGIVFLGTPHRGSNLAQSLNNILKATPGGSKVYVSELEKGSTSLQDINEQFQHISGDLSLVSFYENLKTTIASGFKAFIVEKESAVLEYKNETSKPLDADHHGLSKFINPDDPNYRNVRNVLRGLVKRVKELKTVSSKLLEPPELESSASLEEILGISDQVDDLDFFKQKVLEGSCTWILQKEVFHSWLDGREDCSKIFWLTGPPAVGKTTLSSYIIDYLRHRDVSGSCHYHFFQEQHLGTCTTSYCLRSLAYQMAQKYDTFRAALIADYIDTAVTWGEQNCQVIWEKIFDGVLFRLDFGEPIYWVLDGVDEAKVPQEVVSLLKRISSLTPIRVLVVSRYTSGLSAAMVSDNTPVIHEEIETTDTRQDIFIFVSTSVAKILPEGWQRSMVINTLLAKTNGSFLWISLAIERIRDSWHTLEHLQRALDELPQGMEEMYQRMLMKVRNQKSAAAVVLSFDILAWTTCSFRPLHVDELVVALFPKHGTMIDLRETISQICGHFIAVRNSRVSLIHQTTRYFLLSNAIQSRDAHENIALVCMEYLSDQKLKKRLLMEEETPARLSQHSDPQVTPVALNDRFLWYAVTYWAYHVSCAPQKSQRLQTALFDFLEKYSLIWINAVALIGRLQIITSSAQWLKSYVRRKANDELELPPTIFKSGRGEELRQWANDFIRVVGRFGAYLAESPSSIHRHIIPFCPTESMLRQTFGIGNRNLISVKGISSGKWDDCLARVTMGGDETASKVIAKDSFFLTLLAGSGTLIIWHSETCTEARRLHHNEYVMCLRASQTSNLVCTAGTKTIRIWDIVTGEELYRFPKTAEGRVMAIAFTSTEKRIRVAYDDFTVRSLHLESQKEEWCFYVPDPEETGGPRLMAFSQDASQIAVAGRGRPVYVWTISKTRRKPLRCLRNADRAKKEVKSYNSPEVVVWQPDSSNVIILYQDNTVVDWDLEDDTQMEYDHIAARKMVISADGNLLMTSDSKNTLSVWSTGSFRLIYRLAYDEFLRDIAFSPDAQRLYDVRGTICNLWEPDALIRSDDSLREDLRTQDTMYSAPTVTAYVEACAQISALVSDTIDEYCVAGKDDGTVAIHDMSTGLQLRRLYVHSTSVQIVMISWSRTLKYIASVDDSGRVVAKRLGKPLSHSMEKKWRVFPLLDLRIGTTVRQVLFSHSEEFLLKLFEMQRLNGSHREWVQHPTKPELLICITYDTQELYNWNSLEKEEQSIIKLVDSSEGGVGSVILQRLGTFGLGETTQSQLAQAPELVLDLKDRYIILEYLPNLTTSRRLDMIDLHTMQRTSLPLLSDILHRLVGVYQNRLVFLNYQYWVCTYELGHADGLDTCNRSDTGKEEEQMDDCVAELDYERHFFLPKDWLSPSGLSLIAVNLQGTLLCPKNGEVAIVRSGIRI